MTDLAQRIRDEFPGTPDEEIPGLIRMLRLNRPDDQLRIERNYYRTLAMERAEEVIIWRRRAEGPQAPSVADVLQDLQTKVSAAASNYAREVAALPRKIEPSFPPRPEHRAWSTVGLGCDPPAARPTPPPSRKPACAGAAARAGRTRFFPGGHGLPAAHPGGEAQPVREGRARAA